MGPVFSVAFCTDCADDSSHRFLVLALLRVADVAAFFPNSAVFRASFEDFCSCLRKFLALPLLFLGYTYGVAFFAPSAFPPLISILW